MKIVPYNKRLKFRARKLRKNMTYGEVKLWNAVKQNKLGVDFHRQKPILNYIVDFYSPTLKLVIEVDGSSHNEKKYKYDQCRQKQIEQLGIQFL